MYLLGSVTFEYPDIPYSAICLIEWKEKSSSQAYPKNLIIRLDGTELLQLCTAAVIKESLISCNWIRGYSILSRWLFSGDCHKEKQYYVKIYKFETFSETYLGGLLINAVITYRPQMFSLVVIVLLSAIHTIWLQIAVKLFITTSMQQYGSA